MALQFSQMGVLIDKGHSLLSSLLCAFLVSLLPFFVLPLSSTTPNTSPNSTFFFLFVAIAVWSSWDV
ncbi:hypothetical protein P8452_43413 [Trifolium repens]|nr:hypothetical protein P8452_43413 [Trifolium repens]